MGAISTLPWWQRPGRAQRRARARGVGRGGARRPARGDVRRPLGRQRQRVLVARARPGRAAILLDEPFTGLDTPSVERLEALLAELARRGAA
jgi:ABC-type Mn2+/Zn2+ transport system ATPase subunit